MVLKGECPKCKGEIEFDDSIHLTVSACPLCGATITLISHHEAERREKEAKGRRQQEAQEAKRRRQQEADEAEFKRANEEARRAEEERIRKIKAFHTVTDSGWFTLGWLTIMAASIGMAIYLFQDISASGSDTINLGLMHTRQTGVIYCGFAILVGFTQLAIAYLDVLTHNQKAQSFRQFNP